MLIDFFNNDLGFFANVFMAVAQTAGISGCGSATIARHLTSGAIFEQVTAQATFEIG